MRCPKWISAHDIDRWAATPQAKLRLPELVRRLVYATVPREHLKKIDFPSDAEVQRRGYDGTTFVTQSNPFVPDGVCFWELGCVVDNPKGKAQADYDTRIEENKERIAKGETENLVEATFIAVTAVDWQDGKNWAKERTKDKCFKGVLAYDSNSLEHWIQDAPAVGLWLAQQILGEIKGVTDLSAHWRNVQGTLRQPLPAKILLVSRDTIGTAFADWLKQPNGELAVKAPSAAELTAVFCAWVLTLNPDEQDAISSRAIIVESRETWRELASSQQPLILIASPRFESDPELFAEAIRQGHHVLRFAEFRTSRSIGAVDLPIMRRFDLQQALGEAGLLETDARQLAEAAGGNFTILRRRFANSAYQPPAWAQDGGLATVLLAAAWEDQRAEDQRVLSILADKKYPEIQILMTKWRQVPDAPVRSVLGTWEFLSPFDAWENLHLLLTPIQMDRFDEIAVEVLSEENPALELPRDERYMASVKGKIWRFSSALRRGIAEILALGATREQDSCIGTELHCGARATSIVRRILPKGCGWKRWASLGDLLSLLMEAAPDAVLEGMERDLNSPSPQLLELFRQETPGGIMGAAYHTGVLWALETAAWPKDQMPRVALILARLTKIDPGGQWANRPLASVARLFFYEWPQTLASVVERIDAFRYLCRKEPQGAWKIVIDLLPRTPGVTMGNSKPSYRAWAAGWTGEVTRSDCTIFVSELTKIAIEMVETEPTRWRDLLEHIVHLPADDLAKVLEALDRFCSGNVSGALRTSLWEKLRKLVQDHTYFHDAWWALPERDLDKLAALRDKLAPTDLISTSAYLFDNDGHMEGDKEETYQQKEERWQQKRRAALRAVWNAHGISLILDLVRKVKQPWSVGWALAQEIGAEAEPEIIPSLLLVEDNPVHQFAKAYTAQRIQTEGRDWAEGQPNQNWKPDQIGTFAVQMPFDSRTWDWVVTKGVIAEKKYWTETGTWGGTKLEISESERAAKQLQRVGRSWSALNHFMMRLHAKQELTPSIICDALESIAANPNERAAHTMDSYHIQQAFEFLQTQQDVDEGRVAGLEFVFLSFLDGHPALPRTLQRQLARDPEFFIECLKILYRPRHAESKEKEPADSDEAKRGERIWHLLRNWQTIPGTQKDGFSLNSLRKWVQTARAQAKECDRLEVCDLTLGDVFARAPEDADKAMPLVAIREIIEECESLELERGLAMGFINLRGVYSKGMYDGGKQEREFAKQYEEYAKICSKWPRTATVLRTVAADYNQQADREDEEAKNLD